MSIHVASSRKPTNTKRKPTLKVTEDVATRRKNERKPASRRSRGERCKNSRPRIRDSSRCTMPSRAVGARYAKSIAMATAYLAPTALDGPALARSFDPPAPEHGEHDQTRP